MEEVAGLVEWPVALMGSFNEEFLSIPKEVIRATIRVNQKCFVLKHPDGALANRFILVSNIEATDGGATIVAGNERPIAARLSDAKFFYETDLKTKLEARLPKLESIVFHEKLGTQAQRVERIKALAKELAPLVGADPVKAERAATLCKADLVTEMVGEFPELQGLMGRYYAVAQGEDASVAAACEEHYKPQGPSDRIPTDPVSIAVGLADKIDTLVGFWAIDEKPTGSKDPYALRRAALGVIRLVLENGLRLRLNEVFASLYGWLLALHGAALEVTINEALGESFGREVDEVMKRLPIQEAFLYADATFGVWYSPLLGFVGERKETEIEARREGSFEPTFTGLAGVFKDKFVRNLVEDMCRDGDLPTSDSNEAFTKLERVVNRIVGLAEFGRLQQSDFELNWIRKAEGAHPEKALTVREPVRHVNEVALDLLSFFIDRLKVYLRDRGARYDLIDAALGATSSGGEDAQAQDDLVLIVAKVEALSKFLETEDGKNLLAGFRRAANILKIEEKKDGAGAFDAPHDPDLRAEPQEHAFAKAVARASEETRALLAKEDFAGAMGALSQLRAPVDAFFDDVTVNAEDKALRLNRLRLLNELRQAMLGVADFGKVAGEGA